MCSAHAAVRTLVGEMVEQYERPTVIDMEAGLEHLSRGTVRNVDCILMVIEPYFKSMETGARMNKLAKELEIARVYCLANKIRGSEDEKAIQDFCENRDMELFGFIPNDEVLWEAERLGVAPLDHDKKCAAVAAIAKVAEKLLAVNGN